MQGMATAVVCCSQLLLQAGFVMDCCCQQLQRMDAVWLLLHARILDMLLMGCCRLWPPQQLRYSFFFF
jgi:hypothetical protein